MSTISKLPHNSNLIPMLENGDQLDIDEFLARWEQYPEIKYAELINGVVYMNAAALRTDYHGDQHGVLAVLLGTYCVHTPGTKYGIENTLKLDKKNCLQPDLHIRITSPNIGRTVLEDGYLKHAPEFVAEIANSSSSRDNHLKKKAYEKFGVQEYLVWTTTKHQLDYYQLEDGKFILVEPVKGVYQSKVFPGLWLEAESLLKQDAATCLKVLEQGLATATHRSFVKSLTKTG